jgi:hypothetical protein
LIPQKQAKKRKPPQKKKINPRTQELLLDLATSQNNNTSENCSRIVKDLQGDSIQQ